MDLFIGTLVTISGNPVPEELVRERGWLMDAMADAHKYNADGVPVVYGEPELVYAVTSFLAGNGAMPAVIATRFEKQPASRVSGYPHQRRRRIAGHY